MASVACRRRAAVLVVEDEPLILWVALVMIADAGFEAVGAADADEAIQILESRDDIRVDSPTSTCRGPWTA